MAAMADAKATIVNCPACGAKNPQSAKRCGSCGANTDSLKTVVDERRDRERRYQQEGFSVMWAAVALGVQAVLTAAIIVALPQAIGALDFEGYYGMTLSIPVWFIGGTLVGLISPGKTFVEPVVAALVIAVPTVFYLYNGLFGAVGPGQTVRTMPMFMYIIMALIGVMFTLVGSYVGERIQMGPPPKPVT
jgi:ribosomal protein L40E